MKIAVLGGTFNPIHNGHLNIVDAVLQSLNPDKLIIMPTGTPPHKQAKNLVSDGDRLAMLNLAVADKEKVTVSDYEILKEGKSYTVLTMEHLSTLYPNDELYFVMGSDMLFTFLNWFRPERIMQLATLVGICRDEDSREKDKESAERIIAAGGRCILINCPAVEVSSTEIRTKAQAGKDISDLVPLSVADYIKERGLYSLQSKYSEYQAYLEKTLSKKRYEHSLYVADEALKLARHFGADEEKCYLSGLLHDICKEISKDSQKELMSRSQFEISKTELNAPKTYHGIAASVFIKEEFGITDPEILSAIRYHTVAKGGMSLIEKILYMADLISFDRVYKDVDYIRACTYEDIDRGMYEAMKFSVNYSVEHMRTIPQSTLDAYNEYTLIEIKRIGDKN